MARRAALVGLAVVLVGAAAWWAPRLFQARPVVTSTPSPGPRFSLVDLRLAPEGRACVAPVALDRDTAQARFFVKSPPGDPVTLAVEASGPGYRQQRTLNLRPRNDVTRVAAEFAPPARDIADGRVCIANAGAQPIALVGTNEGPAIGVAQTTLNGRPQGQTQGLQLELLAAQDRSLISRLGEIVGRAADFSAMPAWLLWPLLVLLVVGAPFAVLGGWYAALRSDEV
jgi:hypothetical protein